MAVATNVQMQTFANERVRPRAEQFRNLRIACLDDVGAIDDIYARAVENPGTQWNDNRSDGPPHLLKSGYDNTTPANPDDILNFNSFIQLFEKFMAGSFVSVEEANSAAAQWAVLQDACVRPVRD